MNLSKKIAFPAVILAAIIVIALQVLLYDAEITMAQASLGSVPIQLITEIFITVAIHLFVILMVPMLLIAYRKYVTAYAVLALSLSAYVQFTTGLGLLGATVALIAFSTVLFYGYKQAREWLRFRRAK